MCRSKVSGLWAISFGGGVNLANDGPANTLFFAAGIDDEQHGLFGTLTAIPDDDKDEHDDEHDDKD